MLVGLAAYVLTSRGSRVLRDVRRSLDIAGVPVTVAAEQMGVHHAHLVRGLHGEKHLSLTRLAEVDDRVWQWLAVRVALRVGFPKELIIYPRMAKAALHAEARGAGKDVG